MSPYKSHSVLKVRVASFGLLTSRLRQLQLFHVSVWPEHRPKLLCPSYLEPYAYMHIYIYIYMYSTPHIYIYMYRYMFTYVYVYMYTHKYIKIHVVLFNGTGTAPKSYVQACCSAYTRVRRASTEALKSD